MKQKYKKKWYEKKWYAVIFLAICLVFVPTAWGVFYSQRVKLEEEFDSMVEDNLTSYTRAQKDCLNSWITDVTNTLAGIAGLADHIGLAEVEGDLNEYLENFNGLNEDYSIDYQPMEQLERMLVQRRASDYSWKLVDILKSGQGVVSDIRPSEIAEDAFVFTVAAPVSEDGRVGGVLRTRLDPMAIVGKIPEASAFKKSSTLIVRRDGTILATNNQDYRETAADDLFTSMEAAGIPSGSVKGLRESFLREEADKAQFRGKGNDYYFSWDSLGYNGWYIVEFVRSPDVAIHYDNILEGAVTASLFLVFLTVALGGGIVMLMFRQRMRLDLEQKKYGILEEFSDTALFTYDNKTDTLEFTGNARKILKLDSLVLERVMEKECQNSLFLPEDRGVMEDMLRSRNQAGEDEIQYAEVRLQGVSGDYRWFGCHYKVVAASGAVVKVIGKVADISCQRIREQALREQAVRDGLTGVYNRAGEQLIARLMKEQTPGLFLMMDLDGFKHINDTKGHAVGDAILAEVGKVLKRLCREDDIVARIGGDEFVVFLPGVFDRPGVERKIGEIQNQLHMVRFDMWGISGVAASIGAVLCPEDGAEYETLFRLADRAMYRAKKHSREHTSGKTQCSDTR